MIIFYIANTQGVKNNGFTYRRKAHSQDFCALSSWKYQLSTWVLHSKWHSNADRLCNVLESVTVNEYPIIKDIKAEMIKFGALNSLMSGSGPTVFGIFTDENKAKECNEYLRKSRMVRNSYVAEPV